MPKATMEALIERADKLTAKVRKKSKIILTDTAAQKFEKELQDTCREILLRDLDYALEKNIEKKLWTSGFKVEIDLRRESTGGYFFVGSTDPTRRMPESQRLLISCLRTTSDFYKNLLVEICATFDFELPFLRELFASPIPSGPTWEEKGYKKPELRSCILMCQNCLTHIGDCIRYETEYDKSYIFFEKALELNQLSGHTHNQLGLVNSYDGNLLTCLYHYVRAIATPEPYLKARDNMSVNLSEKAEGNMGKYGYVRMNESRIATAIKYESVFLLLMGRLRMGSTSYPALDRLVKLLTKSLSVFATADIEGSKQMLASASLNQMFAMSVFVLKDVREGFPPMEGKPIFKSDANLARKIVLDLVAGSLDSLLQPLRTKGEKQVLSYEGLPTIKLTLDWIRSEPSVLKEQAFQSRPGIWSSLCDVVNKFIDVQIFFSNKEERYRAVPLPEDHELEGFTVLQPVLSEMRFINKLFEKTRQEDEKPPTENFLRAHRLLKFGEWLAEREDVNLINTKYKTSDLSQDSGGLIEFIPVVTSTTRVLPSHSLTVETEDSDSSSDNSDSNSDDDLLTSLSARNPRTYGYGLSPFNFQSFLDLLVARMVNPRPYGYGLSPFNFQSFLDLLVARMVMTHLTKVRVRQNRPPASRGTRPTVVRRSSPSPRRPPREVIADNNSRRQRKGRARRTKKRK